MNEFVLPLRIKVSAEDIMMLSTALALVIVTELTAQELGLCLLCWNV